MVKSHNWYLLLVLILVFQHNSCTVEKFPYDKSILKHRKNFKTSFSIRLNGYYFRKNQNDNILKNNVSKKLDTIDIHKVSKT